MYRALLVLLLLPALNFGQINPPKVGIVRYCDGAVRAVYGLPASFVVGQPVAVDVRAASFSDQAGILSATAEIRLVTNAGAVLAQAPADENAVVGIEGSPATAIAFLPNSNTLLHFDGQKLHTTELSASLPGRVISLRASGEAASLLVENDHAVSEFTIALSSGNLLSENFLPGVQAPAAYLTDSIVFLDQLGLEIQASNGTVRTIPFTSTGAVSFERMAGQWLHIFSSDSGQQWALHVSPKQVHLSELPLPAEGSRP